MAGGPCTAEVVHRLQRGQSGCVVTLKLMGSADTWVQSSGKKRDQGQLQGCTCLLVFQGLVSAEQGHFHMWGDQVRSRYRGVICILGKQC